MLSLWKMSVYTFFEEKKEYNSEITMSVSFKPAIGHNTKTFELFIVSLTLGEMLSFQNMYVLYMYQMWLESFICYKMWKFGQFNFSMWFFNLIKGVQSCLPLSTSLLKVISFSRKREYICKMWSFGMKIHPFIKFRQNISKFLPYYN